jgi:hypothetical protein
VDVTEMKFEDMNRIILDWDIVQFWKFMNENSAFLAEF